MEFEFSFKKQNDNKQPKNPSFFRVKAFLMAFIPAFIVVSLSYLGVKIPKVVTPVQSQAPAKDSITPKLEKKPNTIKLNHQASLDMTQSPSYEFNSASSYIVVDGDTDRVIAEKNAQSSYRIASITKVMSAIVTLDLLDPTTQVSIDERASSVEPTTIGVVAGQHMSVSELLHAMLITSANDAAESLRDEVDKQYGNGTFIQAMNKKAGLLGLTQSHFSNPQGYDNRNNYSSSADVATLSLYALRNYPLIGEIVRQEYQFIPATSQHKQFDLYNWNGLLGVYPHVIGMKIGNTNQAGTTTVVASKRNNKTILVVVLGAPGVLERDLWAAHLLDIGFAKTQSLPAVAVNPDQLQEKYHSWKYFN